MFLQQGTSRGGIASAKNWPAELNRSVVCIGAQKAATSFLFDQLAKHPDICVPPTKEVHFWDMVAGTEPRRFQKRALRELRAEFMQGSITNARFREKLLLTSARFLRRRGVGSYRKYLLSRYEGEPVLFEATPAYALAGPDTFRLMDATMPDLHLILLMRDPVDRLWSATKYIFRKKIEQGIASRDTVLDFFATHIRDPESLNFRRSDYARTFAAIDAAGLTDRFGALFQEQLNSPVELKVISRSLGCEISLDHRRKVNTHVQHVEGDEALFAEAREAFSGTYQVVRDRYCARVPDSWRA